MCSPGVDDLSMMTYLSQFPSARLKPGAPLRPRTNPSKVRAYGPGTTTTRPHRSNTYRYVDAAYCYRRSIVACRSVRRSVCHDGEALRTEPIEVPFGVWTAMGQRKRVLNGGAHCRHLANTSEPFTCGGDAAFSLQ